MNNDSLDWYNPILEHQPEHLAGSDSWAGHIPFAFYLMAALRPAQVVELGVFAGNSLFAFAQAAQHIALPVQITGIDTWESDPHSGGYDGALIYQLVLEQQARYIDRVALYRSSFDQARAAFAAESVDLLHIDGYHHYEAVRHDFLTWRDTLTATGVVLFHDIAVRRDDFGVWRFWEELQREYGTEQTLAFDHSNGLGVLLLAPIEQYPQQLRVFLETYRRTPDTVQTVFRLAGQRVQDAFAAREQQRQAREQMAVLEEAVANWKREALRQQQESVHWHDEVSHQQQMVFNQQQAVLNQLQAVLNQQQETLNWHLEYQRLANQLEIIYQSRSWKLTAPLRAVLYTLRFRFRPVIYRLARRLKNVLTDVRRGESLTSQHWTIVTPPHGHYVASLLAKRLRDLGMTVELLHTMPEQFGNGLYVVLAAQMFDRLPPNQQLYLYQLEQTLASQWFSKTYLHRLEQCRAVLEYKSANLAYLAEHGIVFPHVYALPIGGNPDLFVAEPDTALTEGKRGVLFYGAWKGSARRRELLNAIGTDCALQREDTLFPPDLYTRILEQIPRPVALNVHHYEPAQLETPRLWEAVSLGMLVVSEDSADSAEDPWLASAIKLVATGEVEALRAGVCEAVQHVLNSAARRQVIEASYQRFCFYFDRFLLAEGILAPDDARITAEPLPLTGQERRWSVPRWCLTLPETPQRYANAARLPVDRLVVGMRRRPAWVGCALSYRQMARQALAQGYEALWILEDDVALPQHFEVRVAEVWAYLSERNDWDICVGHMTLIESELVVDRVVPLSGMHILFVNQFLGMAANLYGRRALEAMACWDPTAGNEYDNTIDQYLKRCGIRVVAIWPYLVEHDEGYHSTLWGFNNAHYEEVIRVTRQKLDNLCAVEGDGLKNQ